MIHGLNPHLFCGWLNCNVDAIETYIIIVIIIISMMIIIMTII